jgi:hypothetical protein
LGFVNRKVFIVGVVAVLVLIAWRVFAQWAVSPEAQPSSPAVMRREACLKRIDTWEARKRAGLLHNQQRPAGC